MRLPDEALRRLRSEVDALAGRFSGSVTIVGTGGREFVDYSLLSQCMDVFDSMLSIMFVSHGNARGADRLFGLWARSRRIAERKLPITQSDWDGKGKAAGPSRNQKLLDSFPKPHVVVAMPGDVGTADMICRSNQQGFQVIDIQEILDEVASQASGN